MSSSNSPERARRPLIGVTGRRSSAERLAVEPRYRHLEFDMHYSDFPTRLSSEGALVVQIPYEASGIDLIERLDGNSHLWWAGCSPRNTGYRRRAHRPGQ